MAVKRSPNRGDSRVAPPRGLWLSGLVVFLVLAGTSDERTFGTITDEIQQLNTSIAIAEFGELGIARGQPFTVHRPGGDAASPWGMGLSLVQAIPALLAPWFEGMFGAGSSQTLFVLSQIGLITLAALGAGLLARSLGAGSGGAAIAVLGTGIGSPLWAYSATNYSEPYQATTLVFTLATAVLAARASTGRRALALATLSGFLAGLAVLGKVVNFAIAPCLMAPLIIDYRDRDVRPRRWLLISSALVGGLPPFGAWLAFEILRFGKPLSSYAGHYFTNPFLDGCWRLLIGPSKGLVLYFPLTVLAGIGWWRLAHRSHDRGAAVAIGAAFLIILCLTAAWWTWDGVFGWGPRYLVPVIPLLGATAGVAVSRRRGSLPVPLTLVALGIAVNVIGALQPESSVLAYVASMPPMPVSEEEARRFRDYAIQRRPQPRVARSFVAARDSTLSPFRTHLFILFVRMTGKDREELVRRLSAPPWLGRRPDLAPALRSGTVQLEHLQSPFSWPHLGAALFRAHDDRAQAHNMAWINGIEDQTLRALDMGRPERARALAERLYGIWPSASSVGLVAEALRVLGRQETLDDFVAGVPLHLRAAPRLTIVMALRARDAGDEKAARDLLARVQPAVRPAAVQRALERPLPEWPIGLHQMIGANLGEANLRQFMVWPPG